MASSAEMVLSFHAGGSMRNFLAVSMVKPITALVVLHHASPLFRFYIYIVLWRTMSIESFDHKILPIALIRCLVICDRSVLSPWTTLINFSR